MSDDYHIEQKEPKAEIEIAADRLTRISELLASSKKQKDKKPDRNILTRTLDSTFALVRKYLPASSLAGRRFDGNGDVSLCKGGRSYCAPRTQLAAHRGRNIPTPCVLALWHRDAPSLLVAFAKRRPPCRTAIMISHDPRGDYLAMLCRMIGFHVFEEIARKAAGKLCYNWPGNS